MIHLAFKYSDLKRIAVILFSILYLIPAVGVSLDLHKCGKKIKVISVNASHKVKCPCGVDMPFDCCKDIHLSVKIVDAQQSSKSTITPQSINFKLLSLQTLIALSEPCFSQVESFDFSNYHAPPFKSKQPVYLTNSIFRIWFISKCICLAAFYRMTALGALLLL